LADVLVIQLTETFKLERTRTALRDFVAHKLKRGDGEDNSYKEASLVAFVAPDSQSWPSHMFAWNTRPSVTRAPARSSPRSG
jgi:hypothetical protein